MISIDIVIGNILQLEKFFKLLPNYISFDLFISSNRKTMYIVQQLNSISEVVGI